MGPIIPW